MLFVLVLAAGAIGTACSSDDSTDGSTEPKETTSTTFPFTRGDREEFCAEYQEYASTTDAADLDPATVPVDELATRWAASIAALRAMADSASKEIKADVELVAKTVEDLQPALAAAGYDTTKVPQAERERFQSTQAREASGRITTYGTQICEPDTGK